MDAPDDLAKRVETLLVVLDQPGGEGGAFGEVDQGWRCCRGGAVAAVGGATVHRPISGKRAGAGRCENHC